MPLLTTTIGAYPKPDYVPILDWFQIKDGHTTSQATRAFNAAEKARAAEDHEALYTKAATEVIADQIACGIDIPTDGEVRRENYIHYHCRYLNGFDFENLTERTLRSGAYSTELPTIRSKITAKPGHFLDHDYKTAQASSDRPVKITVPGPLTISDTTYDAHYGDSAALGADLAVALNHEILALVRAGCTHIQVDEPLFARKVPEALDHGIANLARCFEGVPDHVKRVVHICCGYPNYLDQNDYLKAPPSCYLELADALDAAPIDQISIEDAHRPGDLALLERFKESTILFGVLAIANSALEPTGAIRTRLRATLNHIDAERLIAAPDCGLGFLPRELAMQKLTHMCEAARSV
jgi:5-methyltetrahydropteroyltriglutamate--homocysteine methyltransferase